MKTASVRLTEEQMAILRRRARAKRTTISGYMRYKILADFRRQERQEKARLKDPAAFPIP